MDVSGEGIRPDFAKTVKQHRNVEYNRGKWLSRMYDDEGNPDKYETKVHYHVAAPPENSVIEEAEESPVNFARRPGGSGQKAASFLVKSPKKSNNKNPYSDKSCIPDLHNPVQSYLDQTSVQDSFISNQSFACAPSDSDENEDDVLNKSYKFADDFPVAPFQLDVGIRDYNPDYQKEFLDARDWISNNMSRGPLPSEMVSNSEYSKNLAENSFNDSILSIHNVSRDNYKVNPAEWKFANNKARSSGNTSLPNTGDISYEINPATGQPVWFDPRGGGEDSFTSNDDTTLISTLNSTADSQRRSSWEKNKQEIIQRLYMGDGAEPTQANRTYPVPSKNLKGLYTPLVKNRNNQTPNLDTSRSPSLDFGNVSVIPSPYPYKDKVPDPRTSTPLKAALNKMKSVSAFSRSSNLANSSSVSHVNQSSFFGKLDSTDFSRLNKAITGNSSSNVNSTAPRSVNEDSQDVEKSEIPNPKVIDTTVSSQKEEAPQDSAPDPSTHVPANSSNGSSPNISSEYQLNPNELMSKLSESIPAQSNNKDPAANKLNKTVGDNQKKIFEKSVERKLETKRFVPYGSPKTPASNKGHTVTLSDSGHGVSVHANSCNCCFGEKAKSNCVSVDGSGVTVCRNNCLCLNDSGVSLKIITESDVPRPPCCKNTDEKLNYIAAVNAKKVSSLSKIIKDKAGQFQRMLVLNLKLARRNFQLKSTLQGTNVQYLRQRNSANELEAKHQALQQKFDLVQHKVDQLERESNSMKIQHQQSERMIDTLTLNYDKMMDLTDRQAKEIGEINEQIEEMEAANKEMAATLSEMGIFMEIYELEHSQNDSTFSSMAEDNSVLKGQCNSYQAHVSALENSVQVLDSKIENLSALNESLAFKNRGLAAELSHRDKSVNSVDQSANSSVNTTTQERKLDDGLLKIVEFYKKVSSDLQSQVQQKDSRISELESSMNDTILSSGINNTSTFQSFNNSAHSTLGNSYLEKTADQQALNETQEKLSSARNDVKGLKNRLREAKGVIKVLASNPNKSSDPVVANTLDNIYKEFQKVDQGVGDESPSQNSQLERTAGQEVLSQMEQQILSARNEVQGLKTLLHHAKVIMKELAEDPTKSSDPRVLGAFDAVYKQFKKVDKKRVSFDES